MNYSLTLLVAALVSYHNCFTSAANLKAVDSSMTALFTDLSAPKFSVQDYQDLITEGALVEPYHMTCYNRCSDPKGFLDVYFQHCNSTTTEEILEHYKNPLLFDGLFSVASEEIKFSSLHMVIEDACKLENNINQFGSIAVSLATKAGSIGLVLSENYLTWFLNFEFIKIDYECLTIDFLKFFQCNNVNFMQPTFTNSCCFEQFILMEKYDLADFMADHGARLNCTKAELLSGGINCEAIQKYVDRRVWKIMNAYLPGLLDECSPLYNFVQDLVCYHVGLMVVENVEADIYS